jgi:hypothetical protein
MVPAAFLIESTISSPLGKASAMQPTSSSRAVYPPPG